MAEDDDEQDAREAKHKRIWKELVSASQELDRQVMIERNLKKKLIRALVVAAKRVLDPDDIERLINDLKAEGD